MSTSHKRTFRRRFRNGDQLTVQDVDGREIVVSVEKIATNTTTIAVQYDGETARCVLKDAACRPHA